jgi:hypothetical protein
MVGSAAGMAGGLPPSVTVTPRVRYSPGRREALWLAVRAAEEEAMRSCESARDRPLAVREAKLRVLEEYGVLFRTRGGVPYRRGEAEIIS